MLSFKRIRIYAICIFSTISLLTIVQSGSPTNWVADTTNYPGICYLFNTSFPESWDSAKYLRKLSHLAKCSSNDNWLLGIQGSLTSSNFTWIDGYPVTINDRWGYGEPNVSRGLGTAFVGYALVIYSVNTSETWFNFVCQQRIDDTPPATELQPVDLTNSRCPDTNWLYDSIADSCYIYAWYFYNWNDATNECKLINPNAMLPIFCSDAELLSFAKILKITNSHCDRGWTGLSDVFQPGTFLDSKGFPPNFIPWHALFEHSCNGSSICLDYAPWTEQNITFQPQNCIDTRPFFCQLRLSGINCSNSSNPPENDFCNRTTTNDPTTPNAGTTAPTSCKISWTLDPVHMICYILNFNLNATMSVAQSECQTFSPPATLPIFRTEDEYESYINLINLKFTSQPCTMGFWLGMTTNSSGSFWLDGSPLTFSFSNNAAPVGSCAMHYFNGNGWTIQSYCNINIHYFCQYRLNVPSDATLQPTTPSTNTAATLQNNCPSGWTEDSSDICYSRTNLTTSWEAAQNYCTSLAPNSSLRVFCNISEIDSFNLYRSKQKSVMCVDDAWVGFRDVNGTSEFYWINHENFSVTLNSWYSEPFCTQTPTCGHALGFAYGSSILGNQPCDGSFRFFCQYRPRGNCDYVSNVQHYCQTTTTEGSTELQTSTTAKFDTTTSSTLPSRLISATELTTTTTDASTAPTMVVSTTSQRTVSTMHEETSSTTSNEISTSSAEQSSVLADSSSTSIAHILTTETMFLINETVGETTQNPFASDLFTELEIKSEVTSNSAALAPTIQDASTFLVQYLNDSMRHILGYELKDMIRSCTFKEIPCDFDEDFEEFYSPVFGNCYTFNAGNHPKYWSNEAGSSYGLELTLSASQAEYTCSSSVAGFRVNIHENIIRPFPDAEGFNIPLSSLTGINVQRACQRSCFQDFLQSSCNCADPRYPNSKGVQTCDFKQKQCLDYARDCIADSIECDCPPSCNQTLYKGTLTSSRLINIDSLFELKSCLNESDIYCNVASKTDLSVLSVFYQQMTSIVQMENTAYGMYQLYADICSVTGLVLGVGVITVLEMFVLICMCISWMMKEMF